jgi:hypothetical protein
MVELEQAGGPRREPADPSTHEAAFRGDPDLRLFIEIEAGDVPEVADAAVVILCSLIAVERVTWEGEVHWHEPYHYDPTLDVHTRGDSREAFEQHVASPRSGWIRRLDDRWYCGYWWSREGDESRSPFLAPVEGDVAVHLTPWSDPSCRPRPRDQTHDLILPGFTPTPLSMSDLRGGRPAMPPVTPASVFMAQRSGRSIACFPSKRSCDRVTPGVPLSSYSCWLPAKGSAQPPVVPLAV